MSIKAKDEYCTQCTQMHPVYLDGCPNVKPSEPERGITITTANETDEDAALKYVEMPDWETLAEGNVTEMEVVEGFLAGCKFKEEQQSEINNFCERLGITPHTLIVVYQEFLKQAVDDVQDNLQSKTFTGEEIKSALHKAELEHGKNYTEIWNTLSKNLKK